MPQCCKALIGQQSFAGIFGTSVSEAAVRSDPRLAAATAELLHTLAVDEAGGGAWSQERHCHSTLPLTVIDCHSLGIYTVPTARGGFIYGKS